MVGASAAFVFPLTVFFQTAGSLVCGVAASQRLVATSLRKEISLDLCGDVIPHKDLEI